MEHSHHAQGHRGDRKQLLFSQGVARLRAEKCVATPECLVVCSKAWPFGQGHSMGREPEKSSQPFAGGLRGEPGFVGSAAGRAGKSISDSNTSPVCPLTGGIMAACGKVVQLGSMGSTWTVERLSGCRFWPC